METKWFMLDCFWICYDRSIEDEVMFHKHDLVAAMRKANIQGVSVFTTEGLEKILKGGFNEINTM